MSTTAVFFFDYLLFLPFPSSEEIEVTAGVCPSNNTPPSVPQTIFNQNLLHDVQRGPKHRLKILWFVSKRSNRNVNNKAIGVTHFISPGLLCDTYS